MSIKFIRDIDEQKFNKNVSKRMPFIFDSSFGDCLDIWDLDYLQDRVGKTPIVVHESSEPHLDFISKNFTYKKCLFKEFAKQLKTGKAVKKFVYLRSTNENPRSKEPAKIENDFHEISGDLIPPTFIPFGDNELYHSSVLRISSPKLRVWAHFDLYDNVLVQVKGAKRIILLHPKDTEHLELNNDKIELDLFDFVDGMYDFGPGDEEILKLTPIECKLDAGQSLYIPAMWWHATEVVESGKTASDGYSIGFNIFWRDRQIHDKSHYAQNDVYGNKNLQPVDAAMANIGKAIAHLKKLPKNYQQTYKHMLIKKIDSELG